MFPLLLTLILVTPGMFDGGKTIGFGYKGWSPTGQLNCFHAMYDISLAGCVRECQARMNCGHLVYDVRFYLCQLCDTLIDAVLAPGVISHPISYWGPNWLEDSCINKACPVNNKCTTSGLCILSECSSPPSIKDAALSSSLRGIGSSVRYHCDTDKYIEKGWPIVTCQTNGTWSDSGLFSCQNGWKCRHWNYEDRQALTTMAQETYCNTLPNGRYTRGDDSRAPGCDSCWCCERI